MFIQYEEASVKLMMVKHKVLHELYNLVPDKRY